MEENKHKEPSFQDKLLKIVKDNLLIILVGGSGTGYVGYKEFVEDKRQTELKIEITNVVKHDMKDYMDSLVDARFTHNLKKSLNNPMIWYDALNSDYVVEYAEEKATEIRQEVSRKLLEVDSIQRGFIESMGKALGIRDEDVMPLISKMLKDYVKKNDIRTVTATF